MKSEKNEIRLLEVNEIECRIGTINENGLSLLLYKDARVRRFWMNVIRLVGGSGVIRRLVETCTVR